MFSFPYRPQASGQIVASHKFQKICVRKFTIKCEVFWDEVLSITCTAYIYFPNVQSSRDVYIPILANPLQPKLRYLGDKSSLLLIEILREAYMLVAINLKRPKDRQPSKNTTDLPKFKGGDLVLLKNHKNHILDAMYMPNV